MLREQRDLLQRRQRGRLTRHRLAVLFRTVRQADAILREYARVCARALARSHARSGNAAMIAGYMGSGGTLDNAIDEFAVEYSDQNRRDYRAFVQAVRDKRIEAIADN